MNQSEITASNGCAESRKAESNQPGTFHTHTLSMDSKILTPLIAALPAFGIESENARR